MFVIIGYVIILGCVLGGFLMAGGHLGVLMQPVESANHNRFCIRFVSCQQFLKYGKSSHSRRNGYLERQYLFQGLLFAIVAKL